MVSSRKAGTSISVMCSFFSTSTTDLSSQICGSQSGGQGVLSAARADMQRLDAASANGAIRRTDVDRISNMDFPLLIDVQLYQSPRLENNRFCIWLRGRPDTIWMGFAHGRIDP